MPLVAALILACLQVQNLRIQTVKKEGKYKCEEAESDCLRAKEEESEDSRRRGSNLSIAVQPKIFPTHKTIRREAALLVQLDYFRPPGITWSSCLFQDNPIGDWNGVFDGKLLCNFASLEHTRLVPICDVMPGE